MPSSTTNPGKGLNTGLWIAQTPLLLAFGAAGGMKLPVVVLRALAGFVAWGRLEKAPISPR